MSESQSKNVAIIGGGASGIFAALRCAEMAKKNRIQVNIRVLEATSSFLRKVRISGGGRCNVTHHIFEIDNSCTNYPRGRKELSSPFQQFQAADTVEWFKQRGVPLKFESDGRMFPATDSSSTIIDCFLQEANKHNIALSAKKNVKSLKKLGDGKISLYINEDESFIADSVLLATGSVPVGYRLAKQLGHTISELAPSLFTFKIEDEILENLSGSSFSNSSLTLKIKDSKPFKQKGPLLITHWGLSGPALLKLSAWAAREMMHANYRAEIMVNWLHLENQKVAEQLLRKIKEDNHKSSIGNSYPEGLTKRFWHQLLIKSDVMKEKRWAEVSKKELLRMTQNLFNCKLQVSGKSRFKEEFVECGGISLNEIDFTTMESKVCSGLYFSGEIMDVDGITGGFNFQNAWTSGWIAGENMALRD